MANGRTKTLGGIRALPPWAKWLIACGSVFAALSALEGGLGVLGRTTGWLAREAIAQEVAEKTASVQKAAEDAATAAKAAGETATKAADTAQTAAQAVQVQAEATNRLMALLICLHAGGEPLLFDCHFPRKRRPRRAAVDIPLVQTERLLAELAARRRRR